MVEQVGPINIWQADHRRGEREAFEEVFRTDLRGVSGDSPASEKMQVTLGRLRTIQVNDDGRGQRRPGLTVCRRFRRVFHALASRWRVTPIGGLRDIGVMRAGAVVARAWTCTPTCWRVVRDDDVRLERGRRGDRAPLRAAGQRLEEGEASDALRDETRRDAGSSAGLRGRLHGGRLLEGTPGDPRDGARIPALRGLEATLSLPRARSFFASARTTCRWSLSLDLGGIMSVPATWCCGATTCFIAFRASTNWRSAGHHRRRGGLPGVYLMPRIRRSRTLGPGRRSADGASTVKVDAPRRMKDPKSLEPTSELGPYLHTFPLR